MHLNFEFSAPNFEFSAPNFEFSAPFFGFSTPPCHRTHLTHLQNVLGALRRRMARKKRQVRPFVINEAAGPGSDESDSPEQTDGAVSGESEGAPPLARFSST